MKEKHIYGEKALAVAALEAGFMVGSAFQGHHVHHMDSLVASLAFIQSSSERHSFIFLSSYPSEGHNLFSSLWNFLWMRVGLPCNPTSLSFRNKDFIGLNQERPPQKKV